MEEIFDITISHNGEEKIYQLTYSRPGYQHRFLTNVEGIDFVFEPDEEGHYRTMVNGEEKPSKKVMEVIHLIKSEIEQNF